MMKKIVLFASGSGSNVENIVKYFSNSDLQIEFSVFSNNPKAYVLERAKRLEVPTFVFGKEDVENGTLKREIQNINPDMIVLAGYLWMFPADIIALYPNRVINIHPALLPKYGGKGMYGMNVHTAVIKNNESETGISIHYVNEYYDEGAIIFQKKVEVLSKDTPESVAEKVHQLEYEYFPKVIEDILKN